MARATAPTQADGTYTVPEGNLFTGQEEGGGKTRPEIYVMGVRNIARIAWDKQNNWLTAAWVGTSPGRIRAPSVLRYPKPTPAASPGHSAPICPACTRCGSAQLAARSQVTRRMRTLGIEPAADQGVTIR